MKRFALLSAILLAGCTMNPQESHKLYLQSKALPDPTVEQFPHCQGYGCPIHDLVSLNSQEWKSIDKLFKPKSKSAEQERARIEKAVGLFETYVGPLTGTDVDVSGTFEKTGRGQLDCVDESTNTTVYLDLLNQKGFILFHDILTPTVRWPMVSGSAWWHQTAVIEERETKVRYAIDSWYHDNGKPAHAVELEDWRDGWEPEGGR